MKIIFQKIQYLVSISISKIVNDPEPISYDNKNTGINNVHNNYNYKREKIEITKNIETSKKEVIKANNYNNNYNYKREKKEIVKCTTGPKKEIYQSKVIKQKIWK